jgi:hypothetical protein
MTIWGRATFDDTNNDGIVAIGNGDTSGLAIRETGT